ncbi:MAG: PPOX class probable FMN-dependent enzyme [Gammaproteobacteria bacterium]|jgi:PPOX class probable FMN-dependent enzyme
MTDKPTRKIQTLDQLEQFYGPVSDRSIWKEIDFINCHYQKFIEASPFLILASHGPKGVDVSPRGDPAGFVRVVDGKTILLPDRRGNNRLDSIRNIIQNPSVGIIFLIPNVAETIRVSGQAEIIVEPALLESFSIKNKPATSIISVTIEKAYYQCQKAIARSGLWDPSKHIDRKQLPSAGDMAQHFSDLQGVDFDGAEYDRNYENHMKNTIY